MGARTVKDATHSTEMGVHRARTVGRGAQTYTLGSLALASQPLSLPSSQMRSNVDVERLSTAPRAWCPDAPAQLCGLANDTCTVTGLPSVFLWRGENAVSSSSSSVPSELQPPIPSALVCSDATPDAFDPGDVA